ncbi:unnamed protein product [Pocillopora meandrina]|uniref:Raftlin n=1 Tax=Pocillopora meandrina TaxID=46732 RepID=A0AAU9VYN6_9CNID|nr:unnamed protein product [Pocillopora meandrina]
MNSLRKKVGNFIAGNDTSQTQQTDQQAKGNHTPLPEDQYVFPGIRYTLHFVTIDVTTIGQTTFGLVTGKTSVSSDVTSKYAKLGEPYQQGFILETFKAVPGIGKIGWNASETPYQGVFSRPMGAPVYHSWQLLVVKSSIQTVERAGLLDQLSGRGNDVTNQSGIISVIAQYCRQGGRLASVELTGQKESQGVLAKVGGKSEVFGCDVFFNMPLHQNPTLYTYQLVNVPVQIMYLGPGKLVKVTCDWMAHFTQHLQKGWKLVDIFWDQGKRSHGDFSLSGDHNSVWFFERETKKMTDLYPVYQGTIIEYQHTVKLGFFETKAKGDWTPMITEMGNRGWELACMLETPEVAKIGLGSMTFKVLFFFQRRLVQPTPHGGYPTAIPQGIPGPYRPPQAPHVPPPGAQYPMTGQAAGYYPPQGQGAYPPTGGYPNYAPPPYSAAPEPSAPPLPEKQ